jgi:hypothetical protein
MWDGEEAVDGEGAVFGYGALVPPEGEEWEGVLTESDQDYARWLHEGDDSPTPLPVPGFVTDDNGTVCLWPSSMTREVAQVVVDGVVEARRGIISETVRMALLTLVGEG